MQFSFVTTTYGHDVTSFITNFATLRKRVVYFNETVGSIYMENMFVHV